MKNEWVRVEDRLPEYKQVVEIKYDVWKEGVLIFIDDIETATYKGLNDSDKPIFDLHYDDMKDDCYKHMKEWMPLPEPPEEGG